MRAHLELILSGKWLSQRSCPARDKTEFPTSKMYTLPISCRRSSGSLSQEKGGLLGDIGFESSPIA
jgi:hypothetical protein